MQSWRGSFPPEHTPDTSCAGGQWLGRGMLRERNIARETPGIFLDLAQDLGYLQGISAWGFYNKASGNIVVSKEKQPSGNTKLEGVKQQNLVK